MSDIKPPEEGLDTLSAQFTYEAVRKVVKAIQALREKGLSEDLIIEKISKELRHFDPQSRHRMYLKSLEETIEDDFTADAIDTVEEPKKNTVLLKMKTGPKGIREEMLVQYKGEDYYVASVSGLAYTLKKLVPRVLRK